MRSRSIWNIFLVFLVILSVLILRFIFNHVRSITMSERKYPTGIPDKFDLDGNAQQFPGNTFVCHLASSAHLYPTLEPLISSLNALHEKLSKSHLSHLYQVLPPSSWHVTVFEGVLDKRRQPGYWPADLSMEAPVEECNALFEKKLASFDLQAQLPYRFQITKVGALDNGISLRLEPHTAANAALRNLRDQLSDLLQIRARSHDNYGFHITLAYALTYLDDEQHNELMALLVDHLRDMPKEVELDRPAFCSFETMLEFKPILFLENQNQ
jgi:hypothetical protein